MFLHVYMCKSFRDGDTKRQADAVRYSQRKSAQQTAATASKIIQVVRIKDLQNECM